MTDSYEYSREGKAEQTVKYVSCQRTIDNEFKAKVGEAYLAKTGRIAGKDYDINSWYDCFVNNEYASTHVHRILSRTKFQTSKPVFKSLEFVGGEWVVLFTEVVNGQIVLPRVRVRLEPARPFMQIAR
jgi:hypothetical protein